MQKQKQKLIATFLTMAIVCGILPLNIAAATLESVTFTYDEYKIDYTITGGWGDVMVIETKITNTGGEIIENPMLAYSEFAEIDGIWSGATIETTSTGFSYMKNMGWNSDIVPGQSWIISYPVTNFVGFPERAELCQQRVVADLLDYSVSVEVDQDWGHGFNGRVLLQNTNDKPLE